MAFLGAVFLFCNMYFIMMFLKVLLISGPQAEGCPLEDVGLHLEGLLGITWSPSGDTWLAVSLCAALAVRLLAQPDEETETPSVQRSNFSWKV